MTQITEILASIDAPHFNAGVVLWDDKVIEAPPIIRYTELVALSCPGLLPVARLEGFGGVRDAAPADLRG